MGSNRNKVNKNVFKYEKIDEKGYSNIDERMRYVRYYNRNTQPSFDLNSDSNFMNHLFWQYVHEDLTSHKIY